VDQSEFEVVEDSRPPSASPHDVFLHRNVASHGELSGPPSSGDLTQFPGLARIDRDQFSVASARNSTANGDQQAASVRSQASKSIQYSPVRAGGALGIGSGARSNTTGPRTPPRRRSVRI